MAYPIESDFPVADLVPGDTVISADWQYAHVVVNVADFGFTPDPNKRYLQSLTEPMGNVMVVGQTVKKVALHIYTYDAD